MKRLSPLISLVVSLSGCLTDKEGDYCVFESSETRKIVTLGQCAYSKSIVIQGYGSTECSAIDEKGQVHKRTGTFVVGERIAIPTKYHGVMAPSYYGGLRCAMKVQTK